jgi:hypothetical protein
MLKPKHTAQSVLHELVEGLESGTVTLENEPLPSADPNLDKGKVDFKTFLEVLQQLNRVIPQFLYQHQGLEQANLIFTERFKELEEVNRQVMRDFALRNQQLAREMKLLTELTEKLEKGIRQFAQRNQNLE